VEETQTAIKVEEEPIVTETLPDKPYRVFTETLGDIRYKEAKHEKKAEELLKKIARSRHRCLVRS